MEANFDKALQRVLVYEGGYSNDPDDPGGSTMKGITQGTYNAWLARQGHAATPVRNIPDKDVATIYKQEYWDRLHCDEMPPGVDFCLFDAAVNSGVGGATGWAQAVVGVTVDNDWGPKTKAAVLAVDPDDFIRDFCSRRLGTLQRLRTWKKFGKGWTARIANVQKTALAWSDLGDEPPAASVHTVNGQAKARPQDVPVSRTSEIATNATVAGGVVATAAAQAGQALSGIDFAWVKVVLTILTIAGAVAGIIVFVGQRLNDQASNAVRKVKVDLDADNAVPVATASPPVQPVAQAEVVHHA